MASDTTIQIKGVAERIVIPDDYALLEELAAAAHGASGLALIRVYSAMMALCIPSVGRMCRVDYAAHRFDPLSYGRAVYSWLHGQKMTIEEVRLAGELLHPMVLAAAFPSDAEIKAELGKSPGPEVG
jgi:hypothetical protein